MTQIMMWGICLGTVFLAAAFCGAVCFYCNRTLDRISELLLAYEKGETIRDQDCRETRESKIISRLLAVLKRSSLERDKAGKEKAEIAALLADLSHQMKTPLANILLNTDILKEGSLSVQEQQIFLQRNRQQAEKMQWLMKTLVKASRLEQEILTFDSFPASLTETLARSIQGVYAQARDKGIQIKTKEFQECEPIHNPKWTAEALGNILENAVKYSPQGSSVCIDVQPLEMYIKIRIQDQGPGIPQDEYNLIFHRFYRGKDKEQEEGSGLGLYLAQLILQKEKGYVTVSSREGEGSCFSVFLLKRCWGQKVF